ncbi:MAG TPA: DUF4447 domain-containing protein [Nitrospirae bacterium]|nr:DUF4447 domain-containing protein [Nitrospirota bacterium]
MKCPFCNKKMSSKKEIYHYTESGLDDTYLETDVYRCNCGEAIANIGNIYGLHELIAKDLVRKNTMLNAKEIKYLRKQLHLKANELAHIMSISKVTLSRWENDKENIGVANDKLLRMIYMQICQEKCNKVFSIVDNIQSINPTFKKRKIVIPKKEIKEARSCF